MIWSFFFLPHLPVLQKTEAEEVRQNCETLNNILLAEFDYFSNHLVEDFEAMIQRFLAQQANYHRQVFGIHTCALCLKPLMCVHGHVHHIIVYTCTCIEMWVTHMAITCMCMCNIIYYMHMYIVCM